MDADKSAKGVEPMVMLITRRGGREDSREVSSHAEATKAIFEVVKELHEAGEGPVCVFDGTAYNVRAGDSVTPVYMAKIVG